MSCSDVARLVGGTAAAWMARRSDVPVRGEGHEQARRAARGDDRHARAPAHAAPGPPGRACAPGRSACAVPSRVCMLAVLSSTRIVSPAEAKPLAARRGPARAKARSATASSSSRRVRLRSRRRMRMLVRRSRSTSFQKTREETGVLRQRTEMLWRITISGMRPSRRSQRGEAKLIGSAGARPAAGTSARPRRRGRWWRCAGTRCGSSGRSPRCR